MILSRVFQLVKHIPVLLALLAFGAAGAAAEGRWALILAVSDYEDDTIGDLPNTGNDGRTMASVLNQMGFEVYYGEDVGRAEMEALIDQIVAEQGGSDLGMFYFAGHGLQVDGANFMLPADITPEQAASLDAAAVSVSDVIGRLRDTGVDDLVVILDACRNSPFEGVSAIGTGLALVDAPPNTILAFSTAPGEVASDGVGTNSPYTAALAQALESEETDIRDALRLVRARVRLATGGEQTPWFIDNSGGPLVVTPRADIVAQPDLPILQAGQISLSATAWWTIANSADPRDFETFLALFPDAEEAQAARRQLVLIDTEPSFPLVEIDVPGAATAVPGGLSSLITACDVLASSSRGYMALVEPVPHDLINLRVAIRACTEAVRNDPLNPRLLGLLGWVLYLDGRFPEAHFYWTQAAELGNASAHGGIAQLYRLGLSVPVDLERAASEMLQGALGGVPDLRVAMGVYYREGWGVPQSFEEARRWFELAVQSGHVGGMSALADLYARGQLGEVDDERALAFYRMAAALEHSDAMNSVGMALMRGRGVEQNTDEGLVWLTAASALGNPFSAFHLGRAHLLGWGVEQDPETALSFFQLSARRNFLEAHIWIGDAILATDTPDRGEALGNYIIARDAGLLVDTTRSREQAATAQERIDALLPTLSAEERDRGLEIAREMSE
ncbi:MAG: caspase family protein, partial [Pseudomonadota bacterium]